METRNELPAELTVRVEALHAAAEGDAIAVSVIFADTAGHSEKKELRVRTELFGELKLHKGVLDAGQYEALEHAACLSAAYCRGAGMLAYGASSARHLSEKLRQKGFDAAVATDAAAMLSRQGYIRENEDARREAEKCLSKGWGTKRILTQLRQHGYESEALAEAEAYLGEVDFLPICLAVTRTLFRRPPADRKEREKLAAALFRRGFSGEEIREALHRSWSDEP